MCQPVLLSCGAAEATITESATEGDFRGEELPLLGLTLCPESG